MEMDYAAIGRKIRERRMRKGWTQAKFAERIGRSVAFVGHIEQGTRKLSVETLVNIVRVLRCSADELLGTEGSGEGERKSVTALLEEALERARKIGM